MSPTCFSRRRSERVFHMQKERGKKALGASEGVLSFRCREKARLSRLDLKKRMVVKHALEKKKKKKKPQSGEDLSTEREKEKRRGKRKKEKKKIVTPCSKEAVQPSFREGKGEDSEVSPKKEEEGMFLDSERGSRD